MKYDDLKPPKIEKFEKPSDEELRERIEALGVKGKWTPPPRPDEDIPVGENITYFKKNIVLLEQLSNLLQVQIDADRRKVADLREKVERLKHGGGS